MIWIDVNKELPKAEIPLIVCGKNSYGKTRVLRACYIPKFHMEDDGDSFSGDSEYNEENDMYYWPQGWYEWNEFEDTHWLIDFEIKYWTQLPEPPIGYKFERDGGCIERDEQKDSVKLGHVLNCDDLFTKEQLELIQHSDYLKIAGELYSIKKNDNKECWTRIADLKDRLDNRVINSLTKHGFVYIQELTEFTSKELLLIPNYGHKSSTQIHYLLKDFGLKLKDYEKPEEIKLISI